MIIYGTNCSPTLVGVSGSKSKFILYKANIVKKLTTIMTNWSGTQDTYLPDVLNCGTSTATGITGQYTDSFEITKDAHQSQTIRKILYTHYQLEATSTKGWLNNRRIHVYTSSTSGAKAFITYDYGGYWGSRYIYEDNSGTAVQTVGLGFNMQYV